MDRVDLKELDRSPGFLSSTKKLEQAYRVKLENRVSDAVRMEARESIPVSKDEAIRVELTESETTRGYRFDAVRGFVSGQIDLPRGAEKVVDLVDVVKLRDDWRMP